MHAFLNIIESENFYYKYAQGRSALHGDEFHDFDEIVYCISGGNRLIAKNVQAEIPAGSIIFIPREHYHHFVYENEDSYLRSILHFYGSGEIRKLMQETACGVKVVTSPSEHSVSILSHLIKCSVLGLQNDDAELLLRSAFTALLIDERLFGKSIEKSIPFSGITRAAIDYIDENYNLPISLEDIANCVKVSVSTLSHVFCRDLSISVYRYVTEKRLSAVRGMVEDGTPIVEAALLCGFSDYSAFYRLYKKKYGRTPSGRLHRSNDERDELY
jgi:AraC-like DNA-binding protein